jgi:tetratricopeptide (TPR) repeat protein
MASPALQLVPASVPARGLDRPIHILPVPWRDPHTVSPLELKQYIGILEKACADNPHSADLRTCLGMAYAMNYEAQKSMSILEEAVELDGTHFFAQFKYSELLYRLRALPKAEEETLKAVELAGNPWELSLARKQLQEIRRLIREGTQKPEFNKSLRKPSLALMIMMVAFTLAMVFLKAR